MSKLLNPSVAVSLDKERHLLFGAAAFIEFKDLRGEDLLRFMRGLSEQFRKAKDDDGVPNPDFEIPIKDFRDVLWAGLIHEDETLTPKQTGNLFTLRDFPTLVPLVMEAFVLGLPDMSDNGNPRRAPAKKRLKSIGAE
jgi:hypothetical protein